MSPVSISTVQLPQHQEIAEKIEEELLRSLTTLNSQSTNTAIVMSANNDDGRIIGGVTGSTSYGWLLVKTLWVSAECRGSGIGRQLMLAVEGEALRLDCHSAWLDTSSSKAREFYLELGYADFGVLENGAGDALPDHRRWFMRKPL